MPINKIEEGKIVDEFFIGKTRIRINDAAYEGISEEEREWRLNKIDRTCWKILRAARAEGNGMND